MAKEKGHVLVIKNVPLAVIKALRDREAQGEGSMSHQIRHMLIKELLGSRGSSS
jgi:plasmid stability protein